MCGGCKPLLAELLGGAIKAEKLKAYKSFLVYSLFATLAMTAAIVLPGLMYNVSSEDMLQWDMIWRDGSIKQVTGFTILGLVTIALLISLAKRWKRFSLFEYNLWRYVHVLAGVLIAISLFAHTGFRIGHQMNSWLMSIFVALMFVGGLYGLFMSVQHKLDGVLVQKVRGYFNWIHLLLFWPVPVLLSFHIFKTYYF